MHSKALMSLEPQKNLKHSNLTTQNFLFEKEEHQRRLHGYIDERIALNRESEQGRVGRDVPFLMR